MRGVAVSSLRHLLCRRQFHGLVYILQVCNHTYPVLYLPRLAFYEQIYATVLFFEYEVEAVFEVLCNGVGLARDGNGLALCRSCPLFNEVFDIVVVDVVCVPTSVDRPEVLGGPHGHAGVGCGMSATTSQPMHRLRARTLAEGGEGLTYMRSKQVWSVDAASGRTSLWWCDGGGAGRREWKE
jgi:hypothetical protein